MELRRLKRKRRVSTTDKNSPAICTCLSCSELIFETVLQFKPDFFESEWTDVPNVEEVDHSV